MVKDESVKCVLVTGANGFIGTSLIQCLCKIPNLIIKAMILKGTPTEEIEKIQSVYTKKKLEIVFADYVTGYGRCRYNSASCGISD
jgi:nucleoside-diphosphate-sugar epimerase